jgi:protein-L-isoaspartate(D-aspartate) O-methyltransferase
MNVSWISCLGVALVAMTANCAGQIDDADIERSEMVREQLAARDITEPEVLEAMSQVRRHLFVPEPLRPRAYDDQPLPIGHDQTISQPYIVALMTQLGRASSATKALDVGTGSGYQAAVLSKLVDEVYSIEIICDLADAARERLDRLGYDNVTVRCGDGYAGWPEQAPFDVIIVAAAPNEVPEPLIEQLAPGGRLVIPVGDLHQELVVIEKHEDGRIERHAYGGVRFVPMTGRAASP